MNVRVTPRERGLLKGAVRRAFSRSDLRIKTLNRVSIEHEDPSRPRVKKWGYCELCGTIEARYKLTVDHITPVIPINSSFEELGLDATVDRTWCSEENLQVLCDICHDRKTKSENKLRREAKKGRAKK